MSNTFGNVLIECGTLTGKQPCQLPATRASTYHHRPSNPVGGVLNTSRTQGGNLSDASVMTERRGLAIYRLAMPIAA